MTPRPYPTGKGRRDDASLVLRQRLRKRMPVWHLLFVGCLTRVRTDTSTCNSSTCSPVETRHPQVVVHPVISMSECIFMIPYILTNSKLNSAQFTRVQALSE